MDGQKLSALALLDLSKAFDSIDHSTLLHFDLTIKLHIRVSCQTLTWLGSYLPDRKQFVLIGSSVSEILPITLGVLQGAILSLLLFSIYMNDLPLVP